MKYHKWTQKTDTSPVRRFRFTENEWKLILEAVGHYADHLAQVEYPKHRQIWLNQQYFMAHESNPESEKGKVWKEHTDKCGEIKAKVGQLNRVERQIMLAFKMIAPDVPAWAYTRDRVMH